MPQPAKPISRYKHLLGDYTDSYDILNPAPGMTIWHMADAATASVDTDFKNTYNTQLIGGVPEPRIVRLWDFSGNGYHASTQSVSTNAGMKYNLSQFGSKPGLNFQSATSNGLRIQNYTNHQNGKHTTFWVFKMGTGAGPSPFPTLYKPGTAEINYPGGPTVSTDLDVALRASGGTVNMDHSGSWANTSVWSGIATGTNCIGWARCLKIIPFAFPGYLETPIAEAYVNGATASSSFPDTTSSTADSYGESPFNAGSSMFAEFLHYDFDLSDQQVYKTLLYLKNKWGISF